MAYTARITHWLRITTALTSTLGFALALGSHASANPVDGQVAAGDAAISAPDSKTVQVDQSSQNAVINWQSFNIAPDETTRFVQPNTASWTLNRVTGSTDPSSILGTLTANGNLAIVNPDGILFGENARVDVGGLIATTNDILDSDFMSGNFAFTQPGNPSASIVNEGDISIADYGLGAFVAPGVRNSGVITAKMGSVSLASGNAFTLDLYGDNLVRLVVGDEIAAAVKDVETGAPMDDLVKNDGMISADGGTVALTAATARKAVNSVINNTGVIEAHSVGMRGGKIVLGAQTASTKTANAPVQTVKVSGDLIVTDAPYPSERPAGFSGGKVTVTGENIEVANANIDASGANGGGTILIGGDYHGGQADDAAFAKYGITRESDPISTASYVFLDESSKLNADALENGNGGKVIVWSDVATETAATITARGGAESGDGGFIETSGGYLNALEAADASAPNGTAGTWLLDPYDIYVVRTPSANLATYYGTYRGLYGINGYPTGSTSYVDTNDIETALNAGTNVMITTVGTGGSEHGDIHVQSDIRKTSGGNVALGMDSSRNIYISMGVNLVSTSGLINASLFAPNGQITGYSIGQISLNGGTLFLQGGQGITLSSGYDMPNISLGPDYLAPSVVMTFDQDLIKFSHNGSLATVPSGGIRLVDSTATGGLYINFGSLNYALQDYAVRIVNQRSWALVTDSGAFGSLTANGLNRIPEVVSDGAVNTRFSSTIPQVSGVYPVWEVSSTDTPNCYGLTCLAASPYGQSLIDSLASPPQTKTQSSNDIASVDHGSAETIDPVTNSIPIAAVTLEKVQNTLRELFNSPTAWGTLENINKVVNLATDIRDLKSANELIVILKDLGVKPPTSLLNYTSKLAKGIANTEIKEIANGIVDAALNKLEENGHHFPREVAHSLVDSVVNAAFFDVKSQVVDQSFLIVKAAAGLTKDSGKLVGAVERYAELAIDNASNSINSGTYDVYGKLLQSGIQTNESIANEFVNGSIWPQQNDAGYKIWLIDKIIGLRVKQLRGFDTSADVSAVRELASGLDSASPTFGIFSSSAYQNYATEVAQKLGVIGW